MAAVIGGGGGIGAATARLLHERGWRIAVADIDEDAARRVAADCKGFAVRVDVFEEASIVAAAAAMERDFGPVYGMVNCAAIFQPRQAIESMPMADWDLIVASSQRNTYIGIVQFAGRMAARGEGAIVTMSSMVGQQPNHAHAYASAKAAVNLLTESMAAEWGRSGVRINAVSPGFVSVPRMVQNIREGKRYAVDPAQLSALGRLVEPREVASTIAFLLSDDASAVTGANLLVDAGVIASSGWAVTGGVPPARPRAAS